MDATCHTINILYTTDALDAQSIQPPSGSDSLWRCFCCPEDTMVGCRALWPLMFVQSVEEQ